MVKWVVAFGLTFALWVGFKVLTVPGRPPEVVQAERRAAKQRDREGKRASQAELAETVSGAATAAKRTLRSGAAAVKDWWDKP